MAKSRNGHADDLPKSLRSSSRQSERSSYGNGSANLGLDSQGSAWGASQGGASHYVVEAISRSTSKAQCGSNNAIANPVVAEIKTALDAVASRLEENLGSRLDDMLSTIMTKGYGSMEGDNQGASRSVHARRIDSASASPSGRYVTAASVLRRGDSNDLAPQHSGSHTELRSTSRDPFSPRGGSRTSSGGMENSCALENTQEARQVLVKLPEQGEDGIHYLASIGTYDSTTSNFFTMGDRWTQGLEHVEMIMPVDTKELNSDVTSCPEYPMSLKVASIMVSLDDHKDSSHCVLHPGSLKRLIWDVLGMLFLFYDLITVPIFLAFDPEDNDVTLLFFWLVLIFWTFDIVLNFNTGVYLHGVEELRRLVIAVLYIRSWFLLDVLLVTSDWVALFLNSDEFGVARVGRTVRTLRLIRFLRLVRVIKMKQFMESIEDHINSDVARVLIQMVKLMFLVLLANHLVACGWYVVGIGFGYGDKDGWVERYDTSDLSITYRYMTSMHWSLTQFTTGSLDISAWTLEERVYSVATLVFALMVFSSVLSSITASMTQLRQLSNMHDHKISMLRRYLRSRRINNQLVIRIMRYVQHKLTNQKGSVQESDVSLLNVVSGPLLREMRQCLHQPFLINHPFFSRFAGTDVSAMRHLCSYAVHIVPLSFGDTLFTERTRDGLMYFIIVGRLHYQPSRELRFSAKKRKKLTTRTGSSDPSSDAHGGHGPGLLPKVMSKTISGKNFKKITPRLALENENSLGVGDWCSEGSLWTYWFHLGRMHAMQVSEVLAISAEKFADTVHAHPNLFPKVHHYGSCIVARLNALATAGCLTDLPEVEVYDCQTLVERAFSVQVLLSSGPDTSQGIAEDEDEEVEVDSRTSPGSNEASSTANSQAGSSKGRRSALRAPPCQEETYPPSPASDQEASVVIPNENPSSEQSTNSLIWAAHV